MAPQELKRKLTAILSADVKGYSRLMGENEEETIRTLTAYKGVMAGLVEGYRGRVVDAPGDNLLAEFASVVDAVRCAVDIQEEFKGRNKELREDRRMEFRIGINLGDVVEEDNKLFGDGVNIAARMEGLAEAGGICVSGTVYDHVKGKLTLQYDYLGKQTVKNIAEPVRVYRVVMEPPASASRVSAWRRRGLNSWKRIHPVFKVLIALIVAAAVLSPLYSRIGGRSIEVASAEKMAFPLPDKPSIVVLPFVNVSGDKEQEYFCDGITDQIITSLSMIPRLFVIARDSTFFYKGKAVKVQKVAEEMGVRYVLEGSVQRSGDTVRILVQLIDAIKGVHLWSERYDKKVKDIFALQDEIALKIMTALQVKLTEGEYASDVAGSTSNLQALEYFWHAEEHFFRLAREDNAAARTWAEKAVALDPRFASAWAILGYTHTADAGNGWSNSPAQSMKRAEECAQKALSINDSTAKAQSLMCTIRTVQAKYDEALQYAERAAAINPNDPTMLVRLGYAMRNVGRFDESIAMIKNAMRICPYYPAYYLTFIAPSYLLTGRYQEAIDACEQLLDRSRKGEINPFFAHVYLA
jgi:adenylate cyclase